MTTCHATCLTCSGTLFTNCLTCSTGMTLSQGACFCDSAWQSQCTGQSATRQLVQLLMMLMGLYLVGVMLLYFLRVRLPISYRVWSALNGLSLLLYNQIFYVEYEDQLLLQTLAITNGPYFSTFRIMSVSTAIIYPTLALLIIFAGLFIILYYPLQIFGEPKNQVFDHLKKQGLHFFDCSYFLAGRMMLFYIGKVVSDYSSVSIAYIIIGGIYGVFCLGAWIRLFYQYHNNTLNNFAYDVPIHLYTMLAPVSLIGLGMATSSVILVVIYCSPLALLLLILLLNRNMNIFNKQNIKFYIIQVVSIGAILAFIFLGDSAKTYVLLAVILASIIGMTVQSWLIYMNGYEFQNINRKVVPEEEQKVTKKNVMIAEQKSGYF